MTVQPNEPTPAPEATTPVPGAPQEPAAAAPEPPKPTAPQAEAKASKAGTSMEERLAALPSWARNEIEQLRASKETRQTAADQAAQNAREELAQTIGKALGFVKDEVVDPAELTQQLTVSQAAAQQAQIELAVFKAAGDSADPLALLDSRTFLEKVKSIDPTDTAAFSAAIAEAVEANPRLGKAATATQGMKPNPAQGRSASPPASLAERIAAAHAAGDTKTAVRLKASMALNPDASF